MVLLKLPLEEIISATNDFKDKPIGEGGFGEVYKAQLSSFPHHKFVAVKRLKAKGWQAESEFQGEIELHTRIGHPNIISLLGSCSKGCERILIYEFASNGSLEDHLGPNSGLTWLHRLQICHDVACGIEYLHTGVGDEERIIHRDIKCANILLDHKWQAKVADFGLSKVAPANKPITQVFSNHIKGTQGYMDPQYVKTGILKKESDVYSFGVVLLEVFCTELTNDPTRAYDEQLAITAKKWWDHDGNLDSILDPELKRKITENYSISNDGINKESLHVFAEIAIKCLKVNQIDRPTMREVVKELRRALRLQVKDFDDLRISYTHLKDATNNFHPENVFDIHLGVESFKGEISTYMGHTRAAIVRFHFNHPFYNEFLKKVEASFAIEHESIVSVLGFCEEMGELYIVYEYVSHISLSMSLERADLLTWMRRPEICISLAYGLEHLHALPNADHLLGPYGISSSNILLNENGDAKIFGFELHGHRMNIDGDLAFNHDTKHTETGKKSMYFFGKILLEMLCGDLDTSGFVNKFIAEPYGRNVLRSIIIPKIKKQIAPRALDPLGRTVLLV